MSTNTYSQRQIMLSFAYMAYCGEFITTSNPEPTILKYLQNAMPQIPPLAAPNDTWDIVWGPAVYTFPFGEYQDNMMYIAQNQVDKTQYAIAIRGTNFKSVLDWLLEDFEFYEQVNWPLGSTGGNLKVSLSTAKDLGILLGLTNKATSSSPTTMLQFLAQATKNNPINLCVTGHSLGGVLSTTLALYLNEQRRQWDQTNKSNISCIGFAGPTAGNAAFAEYSDKTFASMSPPPNWDKSLNTNCDAVRCNLDVVPLGFVETNFSDNKPIPSAPLLKLYNPDISSHKLSLEALVEFTGYNAIFGEAGKMLTPLNYKQIVNTAPELQNTFHSIPNPMPEKHATLEQYRTAFEQEAAYQHSLSYPNLLGVLQLLDPNIIVRN